MSTPAGPDPIDLETARRGPLTGPDVMELCRNELAAALGQPGSTESWSQLVMRTIALAQANALGAVTTEWGVRWLDEPDCASPESPNPEPCDSEAYARRVHSRNPESCLVQQLVRHGPWTAVPE